MTIISSTIKSQSVQASGEILVTEAHLSDTGETYLHTWICNDESIIQDVCNQRGIAIGLELERRAVVLQEATNFEIPLTPVEVMRRLTAQEWDAFQNSANINIIYFREVFNKTTQIYRNDVLTQAGIAGLVAVGILTAERAVEVMQ